MSWMETTKKYLKQYMGYIVIVFACLIYIARGIITIEETGKTILQVLADGSLALFFGIFINIVFELQGIMEGDRNEKVIATNQKHADIVEKISPNIDKLDDWCDMKNKEALKLARVRKLSVNGLKYEDCFDEEGVAKTPSFIENKSQVLSKEEKQLLKAKMCCYKKACRIKLTLLTTNSLTSEGGREYDPYYLGQTKKQYKQKTVILDLVSKLGVSVIFGVYGAKLVKSFSWAFLIWTGIQVVLFLIMGVIKLYTSYMFVVDDHRARTIKKIDNLTKFSDYIKNANNNQNEDNNETKTDVIEEKIEQEENNNG